MPFREDLKPNRLLALEEEILARWTAENTFEMQQKQADAEAAFWQAWAVAKAEGISLETFLKRMGVPPEERAEIMADVASMLLIPVNIGLFLL